MMDNEKGVTSMPDNPRPVSRDWGGIVFAIILVAIGAYFVLRDTLGYTLPDIAWSKLWPLLVVVLDVAVLLRDWTGHSHHHRHDRGE
jgi:hypothetical protein